MLYTVKEVSKTLGISIRAVQKRCIAEGIDKTNRVYLIPKDILSKWELNEPNERTANEPNELSENETITEAFTPEQYDKLNEVILKYPELVKRIEEYQQEIKFLRTELQERSQQLDKKGLQLDKLIEALNGSIKTTHQSNYIQAKDKGLDTV
ncbi:hypothetical protein [Gillisia sp. JM1]|uniref:hypothetical protein n=1 Tax=Gillisia sp. JM1 TaxID=1283286 RepID=UPI000426D353|nr:hypothetical protein [Gillisia sp. JM1]